MLGICFLFLFLDFISATRLKEYNKNKPSSKKPGTVNPEPVIVYKKKDKSPCLKKKKIPESTAT
jgi:hypothetical protein